VQNGQEGGTPLGNSSPCTAFIKVTSEEKYRLFLGFVFFNSLTLPRMHPPFVSILLFFRLRIIVARIAVAAVFRGVTVCHSCLHQAASELAARANSSSSAIRAQMLTHLGSMIISYSTDMHIPLDLPPILWRLFVWTG